MGRTILCPHCKSTFDESILAKRSKPDICPVCENSLLGDSNESSNEEVLSFGEGVVLGENDSFEEDKIDFYFNGIIEPNELGKGEDGLTGGTCVKCGHHTSFLYPIAKKERYILLDPRETGRCSNCGNVLKNHILCRLPEDWVDPRKRDMWTKDYANMPKCPVCSSTKIHKISMTNKAASAIAFGVLAAGHVSKTYKCDICGAKF